MSAVKWLCIFTYSPEGDAVEIVIIPFCGNKIYAYIPDAERRGVLEYEFFRWSMGALFHHR